MLVGATTCAEVTGEPDVHGGMVAFAGDLRVDYPVTITSGIRRQAWSIIVDHVEKTRKPVFMYAWLFEHVMRHSHYKGIDPSLLAKNIHDTETRLWRGSWPARADFEMENSTPTSLVVEDGRIHWTLQSPNGNITVYIKGTIYLALSRLRPSTFESMHLQCYVLGTLPEKAAQMLAHHNKMARQLADTVAAEDQDRESAPGPSGTKILSVSMPLQK
ncbi:hypothetical protein 3 [Hubei rhabdo-like virus 2]|uniref:hypothetical protein 3 n=1 Tax=Hubei rhabdo-like virus 2 TaxID=1923186 RepID=UPI00090AF9F3|nr:hypothetical protein 3 [Hubei rhabdo-like virus 2]APG78809.1 hypothetical protein 3 [Hubei rhabdo-like virus 2]